jgi:DNA repair exonuclease SbcCD ATPase subunit
VKVEENDAVDGDYNEVKRALDSEEEVNPNEELKREHEQLKIKHEELKTVHEEFKREHEDTIKAISQQKNLLKREFFIAKDQVEEEKVLVLSSNEKAKQLEFDKHKLQINNLILTADYEVLSEENNEIMQEKKSLEEKCEKIIKDNDEIKDK